MKAQFQADTLEIRGLEKLLKALKTSRPPIARVGILGAEGSTQHATGAPATNAEIGAVHEFGSPTRGIPMRSWLRMPLNHYLNKQLEQAGAFTKDEAKEVVKTGSLLPWVTKMGIVAVSIVQDAFGSNGFGSWAPWKNGYSNNTGSILVDTQQLRNSVTYDVKERS